MNQDRLCANLIVIILCTCCGPVELGFTQASSSTDAEATIQQIMSSALARCYSTVNGIRRIAFEPATNEEFARIKALGPEAVTPLAKYLDASPQSDFSRFFAVKFLMAIGGPSTLGPLKRAFAPDQWEVTRAAALSGMFTVSRPDAKPFIKAALVDQSHLVRQRARELWALYQP